MRIVMFSRRAVRASRVFPMVFKCGVRRVARFSFSALRAVVAWAARRVLSDFLQQIVRAMVVFVGSRRAWWRHLRWNYAMSQARGAPFAHVSEVFQMCGASVGSRVAAFLQLCVPPLR